MAPVKKDIAAGWRLVDLTVAMSRRLPMKQLGSSLEYVMLLPALFLVTILAVGLFNLLWLSIHSYDAFRNQQGPISLEQYRRLLIGESASFYRSVLLRTFTLSVLVTIGSICLALPVSYFIVHIRSRSWRFIALNLLLIPFLMGEIVRAFGWLLLLGKDGAVPWLLGLAGIHQFNLVGTWIGIWPGMIQVMMPISALVMLPAVRRIGADLERAAETLGARPWKIWWHIIIPLAQPGLVAAAAVSFTLSMTEYAIPQVLGLGRLPFVANAIENIYFLQNNIYLGSAFALVLVVVVTIAVVLLVRLGRGWSVES